MSFFSWWFSWTHSCSSSLTPPLSFSWESPVSESIILFASCLADISKEKMATGLWKSTAALRAMFSTRAVLPTDGRAAMIMRSEACQPSVILSNDVKPDGTPLRPGFS